MAHAATELELVEGDCVAGMRAMPEGSVQVVVTSPPYNIGVGYGAYEDGAERGEYLAWCAEWGGEIRRVLAEDGSFFLNLGASPKSPLLPHQLALQMAESFVLQNTIHWIKSITVEPRSGGLVSVGHFKPINSERYINDCHEYVFHFTKTGSVPLDRRGVGVPYQDKSNIGRWGHTGGEDLRCRGNTWFIPYETIRSRERQRPHPATFPVRLAQQCVTLHGGVEAAHVLDPFLGIGSAALGAMRAGARRFTGFEIDPGYLEVARARVGEEAGMLL